MSQQRLTARVVGIPHIPSITQVNVRTGAGTSEALAFKVDVGTDNLAVMEVQRDQDERNLNGKVYQWFRLQFADCREGWIRDDLIEIVGDGRTAGYPLLSAPVLAFNLYRIASGIPVGGDNTPVGGVSTPVVEVPEESETPVSEPVSEEPADAAGNPARAMCMAKTGVNMRSGPGTNHSILTRMQYQDTGDILESAPGVDGKDFLWVKLRYQGIEGWVREDFLRYSGDFGSIGSSAPDQYPNPVPQAWWIRDFDLDGTRIGVVHHGWDCAGDKGFPIKAGPRGGKVIKTAFCQRCGTEGFSTVDKGFSLSDSRIFRDQGWNFGYGHFVIVRYLNDMLPATAQAQLARRGFEGAHAFVMYAHLQDILVQEGQELAPDQQIATLGNSGNSSGAHLHLEVRVSQNPNETRWARMIGGLMTPGVLFNR